MIYLDNAATTYPKPLKVYEALDYAQRNLSFNAGRGAYDESKKCSFVLDELRKEIASFCHGDYKKVSILSSATEALNMIINGLNLKEGDNVYITPFEHNAIIRPLYNLKSKININIIVLPFNKKTWKPDYQKMQNMFAVNNPAAVFVSQISNVTGLMIDYSSIFRLSKDYSCTNVLDAAQGYGIVGVNKTNVDFIVFAGHKSLYGPFGIGGFINLSNFELEITKSGGNGSDTLNHEMPKSNHERYESGSFNIPSAYGLLTSIRWLKQADSFQHIFNMTQYLINNLSHNNKINIYLPESTDSVFGIVSISVDGYKADEVGNILYDEFKICTRTGYHCSPFVHEFINSTSYGGTVRISLSSFTTKEEIDELLNSLGTL